ncbi:N/A [soil metagenome]
MREFVKQWLLSRGMILSRPPGQFSVQQVKLENAKRRGLKIEAAIDGGASDGSWARQLKETYPNVRVLCVEPRDECQAGLAQTARDVPGVDFAATLLGDFEGMMQLNVHDTQSSILNNSRGEKFGETVKDYPITTLDKLIAHKKFPWPDLIKLDLQGAELQALAGATECLRRGQALLLEVSFIELQKGCPLLYDVVTFCHNAGYRVYDIPSLWHRPLDGALAQGDFLFLKHNHPLLRDARWSEDIG